VAAPGHFLQQQPHGSDSGHGHVQLCAACAGKVRPALDAGADRSEKQYARITNELALLVPADAGERTRRYDATSFSDSRYPACTANRIHVAMNE